MESSSPMWPGTIIGQETAPRGTPPLHALTIAGEDGRKLDIHYRPPSDASASTFDLVSAITPGTFAVCPICLAPGPDSEEHVPQGSLGGQVMTMTCEPCNNRLGSRIESEFLDWSAGVIRHARARSSEILGSRRMARVVPRRDADGSPVWTVEGCDPAVAEMLATGGFTMEWVFDRRAVQLAALKHAYLAACLVLRGIPDTSEAQVIRDALVAARDTPKRASLPKSPNLPVLDMYRSYGPPQGPGLGLMRLRSSEPSGFFISLAGAVCVSWPLPSTPLVL
jgi:hypothetical protein